MKRMNPWLPGLLLAACCGATLTPTPARGGQVALRPALAKPFALAGSPQTAYLEIGLQPFTMAAEQRAPVNVAIVIDRSGSMSGHKIRRAKEAARLALARLRPDDIVSVVAYNHGVEVLVPATKVSDRAAIAAGIRRLRAGGSTALFAGVSKGAAEVRKFMDRDRINRVVLLSDGLANVGPDSPAELGALGASLGREGIGVTTIGLGLGYNEDLMTRLAMKSEGNHFFARTAADLQRGFDLEFSIGLAVVAKEVEVEVVCAEGVRPIRVLNADAQIVGQRVVARLNQLYSGREAELLLEVELPAGEAGQQLEVAEVGATYLNLGSGARDALSRKVRVRYTDAPAVVRQHTDRGVMEAVALQLANQRYKLALELRDRGQVREAREMLEDNDRRLQQQSQWYQSKKLKDFGELNRAGARNLSPERWQAERKRMRDRQLELDQVNEAF